MPMTLKLLLMAYDYDGEHKTMPMTVNVRLLPMTMTRTIVANHLWLLTMRIITYDYEHKAIICDHDFETITVNCLWLFPRTILDH